MVPRALRMCASGEQGLIADVPETLWQSREKLVRREWLRLAVFLSECLPGHPSVIGDSRIRPTPCFQPVGSLSDDPDKDHGRVARNRPLPLL
jgi:hypothetical protein